MKLSSALVARPRRASGRRGVTVATAVAQRNLGRRIRSAVPRFRWVGGKNNLRALARVTGEQWPP